MFSSNVDFKQLGDRVNPGGVEPLGHSWIQDTMKRHVYSLGLSV